MFSLSSFSFSLFFSSLSNFSNYFNIPLFFPFHFLFFFSLNNLPSLPSFLPSLPVSAPHLISLSLSLRISLSPLFNFNPFFPFSFVPNLFFLSPIFPIPYHTLSYAVFFVLFSSCLLPNSFLLSLIFILFPFSYDTLIPSSSFFFFPLSFKLSHFVSLCNISLHSFPSFPYRATPYLPH